jgi:hypothetical protein
MKYEHFLYDWNPSFFRGFESSVSCNHLYHRIFLFVSSSPTCHVFLWTFQTSYTRTYSHSKKYLSRVSTKYSTRTRNFIDMYMSYRPLISYDLGHRTEFVTSRRGHWPLLILYYVSLDEIRCFSKRYPSYALRKHMCGSTGCGGR